MMRITALFALLLLALTTPSCLRDKCESMRTFIRLDPVYKTIAECRVDLRVEGPRPLQKPGKIYAFNQYLFINEIREGVHVIDNSDPANPVQLAFWNIPGNVDITIKDQYLYADQYVDLLTFDISNLQQPQLLCRRQNVFSMHGFDPYRGYIVDYAPTEVTDDIPCNDQRINQGWFFEGDVLWVENTAFSNIKDGSSSIPSNTGIAGSYARFGLHNDFLYVVDRFSLKTFTLTAPDCPAPIDSSWLGWNIETIFPWKDKLFVGSQNGVFIFDNKNPQRPVLEATFSHATGCDPVVCDDNYAYVTIHDGVTCRSTTDINQLDVIGISQLPATALLSSYQMTRPMGLTITNDHLYLCDDGLKVFDKKDPLKIQQLAHLQHIKAYDVILLDLTHLMVIGEGGFFQYDVSNPAEPKQISHIPVN